MQGVEDRNMNVVMRGVSNLPRNLCLLNNKSFFNFTYE